jgi:GT2 family glycosyltransferase
VSDTSRFGAGDIAFVAAVNNDEILANNLLRSPAIAEGGLLLQCYRGYSSASTAYNAGLEETESPIVVFVHQDVFLPAGWIAALRQAINHLDQHDPDWAVIGAYGRQASGRFVGHVWSSGIGWRLGKRFDHPIDAVCLDELVIVMRRAAGIRFDERLPGFHLYGTDIVQTARAAGLRGYVADIPVIHNRRPVRQLGADYLRAYRYMRRKWRETLPVLTPVVAVSHNPWPLLRIRLRLALTWKRRARRAVDWRTDPRRLVQKLDLEKTALS